MTVERTLRPQVTTRLRPGGDDSGYDPWLEIDSDGFRHNVIEVSRLAGHFAHELEFDRIQQSRFLELVAAARSRGVSLGTLHATPTFELFHYQESLLGMVRVGNALFGNYPTPDVRERASLKPVFRLKARLTRAAQVAGREPVTIVALISWRRARRGWHYSRSVTPMDIPLLQRAPAKCLSTAACVQWSRVESRRRTRLSILVRTSLRTSVIRQH
jgi:hypothetical protein